MGTEAGRDVFHTNLWVYTVQRRCDPNKNYVIADVRFPNEIKAIREAGGKVLRVRRGSEPTWWGEALATNRVKENNLMKQYYPEVHYSEWAWIGEEIDETIENDKSLEELAKRVDLVINV